MTSFQESQSDLEVILEFLEEYYRQNSVENGDKVSRSTGVPLEERPMPVDEPCEQCWTFYGPASIKSTRQPLPPHDARPAFCQSTTPTLSDIVSSRQSAKHPATGAGSGRKVRLFHFLFEMLEDPSMAHCLSWVPTAAGVFRFSSRNKDQVAALWGQRKGNKRPMTYQKMSRALRNYARSGEIFKVKKKLTYQFSRDTLQSLQRFQQGHF
ncbi:transcription factor Spi-B-like [Menidia menidia]